MTTTHRIKTMVRLMNFAARRPYVVLLGILLVSLVAAWHVSELQIQISPQSLTMENDPAKSFYEQSIETFGSDDITILFLQDPQLFQPDKLEAIRNVLEQLNQLPYVIRTQSLFSLPNLRVVDDFVITNPYLNELPRNQEEANKIITEALRNPFVKNNLLSDDGTAMAINIHLSEAGPGVPGRGKRVVDEIERVISSLNGEIERVFQIGPQSIRSAVQQRIEMDLVNILPIAITVLLISLAFSLRSPCGAIIPLLTSGLSVLYTLGLMASLDIPLSIMTALVPVLLIIIGSTEDIHLINEFNNGVHMGYNRQHAIGYMTQRMGFVVFLTFLTTCIGFLSIATSQIQLVYEFGLVAALGMVINFILTILIVPAYLRLFGNPSYIIQKQNFRMAGGRIPSFLADTVLNKKKTVITLSIVVSAAALFQAREIQIDNSVLNYFEPESSVMHRVSTMNEYLSGTETFSVILDSHTDNGFKKVRNLNELQKLQRYLNLHPAFDFTISFTDYLSLVNSLVNDSGESELPAENSIIEELLLFVNHQDITGYVSQDFRRAHIMVRHNITSSRELGTALAELDLFIKTNIDHNLEIQITGESILTHNATDSMAMGQVHSLMLTLVVIFVVITLLFFNPKAGILAILPNIFLVTALFGIMGFLKIPLDTGTAMIAVIALGVCVDHTIHFMVRYRCKLRETSDAQQAIVETIHDEAKPISTASLALAAGLGSLMFSSFTPVAHFGAMSAMVMLLAFYANFFITPVVLSYTKLNPCISSVTAYRRKLFETECYSAASASSK